MKEKNIFKKLWDKIKDWAELTAWPWLKKSWMQIINIIVVFIAYSTLYDTGVAPGVEALVGFWGFTLLVYYIFWKLFGLEKYFIKKEEKKPQPVKPVNPITPIIPVEPDTVDKPGGEKEEDMKTFEAKKPVVKKPVAKKPKPKKK